MSSFNESVALGYLKQAATELVNYNKRQMSRIYPKGNRVDSSNFMPQIFWNAGCQVVALNFQTSDLSMQLNQGKFEYNGNCGYLLKPDFMRRPDRTFDPFSESPVDGVIAANCAVQVISGQFLSDKKVGTYVEVDMYGLPTDTIRKEFRTRTIPANGLNPVYNEEPFVFRKVVLPDLAVVRIAVYEDTGKLIGQRILPLEGLQSGYRHISLRTEGNFPLSMTTIFCRFILKTYVPEGFGDFVDALSAPIQFLSQAEKRAKQLQGLGIDETDISEVSVNVRQKHEPLKATDSDKALTVSVTPTSQQAAAPSTVSCTQQQTATGDKETKVSDDTAFKPMTVEQVRTEKAATKLLRRQAKELDGLRRRQTKERCDVQRQQCSTFDKQLQLHERERTQAERSSAKKKNDGDLDEKLLLLNNSQSVTIRALIGEQTVEWTDLLGRHIDEQYTLSREHLQQQLQLFTTLMQAMQQQQLKDLELKHERENKELKGKQAKQSVDSAKLVVADKAIKNRAERDRRIRELNENNTKKFIEERKRQAITQSRQIEAMRKKHQEQLTKLNKDLDWEIELLDIDNVEDKLAHRPQTLV